MELICDGISEATGLIIALDRSVLSAAFRSLWISLSAVGLATMFGLPVGTFLARREFSGRGVVVLLFRGAMSFPTVFIGIVTFAIFSRSGPGGSFELLYTPWVMVFGEFLLAFPIVVSLSHGAIKSLDPRVGETALVLGASPIRRWRTYMSEARVGIALAIITAFARCVTELGIAMMVGGNIKDRTRTLATATALETSQGEFARGLAMGSILLVIALGTTIVVLLLSRESKN